MTCAERALSGARRSRRQTARVALLAAVAMVLVGGCSDAVGLKMEGGPQAGSGKLTATRVSLATPQDTPTTAEIQLEAYRVAAGCYVQSYHKPAPLPFDSVNFTVVPSDSLRVPTTSGGTVAIVAVGDAAARRVWLSEKGAGWFRSRRTRPCTCSGSGIIPTSSAPVA